MDCSIDLLSSQSLICIMTENQGSKKPDESVKQEITDGLKELNRRWYQKTWLFILSLILGPATFITGFFVEFEPIWQSAVQSIFFVISAAFFVLTFSYLFNITWLYALKKKTDREYMLSLLLQVFSILAILPNLILICIRFTSRFVLTDVRAAVLYATQHYYSQHVFIDHFIWDYQFAGEQYWFHYYLGTEFSQTFILLLVIFLLVIVILGITSYFTFKKIKKPFVLKDHLKYISQLFFMFFYGVMVLWLMIKKLITNDKFEIKDSSYLHKFKETVIFLLVPIIFLAVFFAIYFLLNHSFNILFETPWPFFF